MAVTPKQVLVTTDWVARAPGRTTGIVVAEVDENPRPRTTRGTSPARSSCTGATTSRIRRRARPRSTKPSSSSSCSARVGSSNDTTVVLVRRSEQLVRRLRLLVPARSTATPTCGSTGRRPAEVVGRSPRAHRRDVPSSGEGHVHRRRTATNRSAPIATTCTTRSASTGKVLVDVRSPQEYSARPASHRPATTSAGTRSVVGHIPTAKSIPWAHAVQRRRHIQVGRRARWRCTATTASRLEQETIAYCRIGERSAHTSFVLRELTRLRQIVKRSYDGSVDRSGVQPDRRPLRVEKGS